MKQCSDCQEWKPDSAFTHGRRRCVVCHRARDRAASARYADKNRDRKNAYMREYRKRPSTRERNRLWWWAQHTRNIERKRSERSKELAHINYLNNKQSKAVRLRLWRSQNPDKVAAINRRRRARRMNASGTHTASEWKELCATHGYRCLACGKQEPDIKLTADHILPLAMGGTNDISNIQPLCGPCNSSKLTKHIDYRLRCTPATPAAASDGGRVMGRRIGRSPHSEAGEG